MHLTKFQYFPITIIITIAVIIHYKSKTNFALTNPKRIQSFEHYSKTNCNPRRSSQLPHPSLIFPFHLSSSRRLRETRVLQSWRFCRQPISHKDKTAGVVLTLVKVLDNRVVHRANLSNLRSA